MTWRGFERKGIEEREGRRSIKLDLDRIVRIRSFVHYLLPDPFVDREETPVAVKTFSEIRTVNDLYLHFE